MHAARTLLRAVAYCVGVGGGPGPLRTQVGYPPFYSDEPLTTCRKIVNWRMFLRCGWLCGARCPPVCCSRTGGHLCVRGLGAHAQQVAYVHMRHDTHTTARDAYNRRASDAHVVVQQWRLLLGWGCWAEVHYCAELRASCAARPLQPLSGGCQPRELLPPARCLPLPGVVMPQVP